MLGGVPLRLNLAALTEAELLALYGPAGVQARFPEISRARLQGQPILNGEVPPTLMLEDTHLTSQAPGATPQQSLALKQLHAALLETGALADATFLLPPTHERAFLRAYVLGETAICVRWLELPAPPRQADPALFMLTWLRDRASGVACVLTTTAHAPAPAYSEEVDLHLHPEADVPELLRLHRQHVNRHGKPQKLAAAQGWRKIWQALHDLNLRSWQRRGVLVEVEE